MKKQVIFLISSIFLLVFPSSAQLLSGPMVGYSEMTEVMLWVQTMEAADVRFEYWDTEAPERIYSTATIRTDEDHAFIAKLPARKLLPGKKYGYTVLVNNESVELGYPAFFQTQVLWQHRSAPPDFSFVYGSCYYENEPQFDRPGKPYGSDYEIFTSIDEKNPDFMVWGGDNVYLRPADWNTRDGFLRRYTDSRKRSEIQPLFARTHHYALWDDHDYGSNDSDRSFWEKRTALEVFKLFWANPRFAFPEDGITGTFHWADCQFFILDDRWWKAPNNLSEGSGRDYFGKQQVDWLIDALVSSRATFKFIVNGGQIINPAKIFENMANYEAERNRLLEKIREEDIPGIIFLTGDRHHGCLQKLERENTYPLYELTSSPLTAGVHSPHEVEEEVTPFVPGTIVAGEHNFAFINVSGPLNERVLTLSLCNKEGDTYWTVKIPASELK